MEGVQEGKWVVSMSMPMLVSEEAEAEGEVAVTHIVNINQQDRILFL
jgi:hypothetical protein